jgi:hypothetical protein
VATYTALAATSEAIRRYLKESPHPEFTGLDVDIYQASDFTKPAPAGGRISIFLYRVGVTAARRNLPPKMNEAGTIRMRPAIPLDLFYAISAWAMHADLQQRLLGWAIRTLEDAPVFPASVLNQLQTTPVFRKTETVELVCDPWPIQDLGVLWELLKPNVPLSVGYVARMLAIESEPPQLDERVVQTRDFDIEELV